MKSGIAGHWSVKNAEITGAGLVSSSIGPEAFVNIKGSGFGGLLSCREPKGIDAFCGFIADIFETHGCMVGCPVRVKFNDAGGAIALGHMTSDELWFHFSDVEGVRYVADE